MLGKVFKYDCKTVIRYLCPLYLVIAGFAVMIRLLGFFDKISVLQLINGLLIVGFVFLIGFSFLLTGIFCVKHYLENLFKDEGYLTHTLPVKKGTLLLSKVLVALLFIVLTFLVVVVSLIIAFYQGGMFKEALKGVSQMIYGMEVYKILFFFAIYSLIAFLTTLLMVYAAIAIGFSKSSNKIINSVVFGLIFYFAIEFIYLGVLAIVMGIHPSLITNLESNVFMMNDLLIFMSIFMILTFVLGGIFYYISYRFINKRLNLE